jgi:EAL domain-containing protein (putative c-di-GMP-specific phosphodiesterase class I)
MDPLDVVSNIEKVLPFFQPVYSADTQKVAGFESVGRIHLETFQSLEFFFKNDTVPEEFLLEVENELLKKSLQKLVDFGRDYFLFINRHPKALLMDDPDNFITLLQEFEDKGLKLSNIVLVLNHGLFHGSEKELKNLITYYQTYGIKIAIDSISEKVINLSTLRYLSPDIIKIDLKHVKNSIHTSSFQDILQAIIYVAGKMGASIYYDGISDSHQLRQAWKNGGRFYQGAHLSLPDQEMKDSIHFSETLKNDIHHFIAAEKTKLESLSNVTYLLQQRVEAVINKYQKYENFTDLLSKMTNDLQPFCFRMYICDGDGYQQTANLFKLNNDSWIIQEEYVHKNWSWRPYFLETVLKMRVNEQGIMSDLYRDIETGEKIRTFSYPMEKGFDLYIDLSYDFLFKHDELLF